MIIFKRLKHVYLNPEVEKMMRQKAKILSSGQNFPKFSERQCIDSRGLFNSKINMKTMTSNIIVKLMKQKVKRCLESIQEI